MLFDPRERAARAPRPGRRYDGNGLDPIELGWD
jgi:hypothetical protein